MLMMGMKTDPESQSKGIMTWPQEDIQAHIGFMIGFNKQLQASGELVSAEGLAWPDQALLVRADKDGAPVTDGVFPESKEFLIGYWVIDVENAARARQVAAAVSAAPGPGGVPLNMPIEVRQIMSGPPEIQEAEELA
ncbi:MAG: YciI family protein [Acidobacteriota bacterium]